jgi:hypothetical protein
MAKKTHQISSDNYPAKRKTIVIRKSHNDPKARSLIRKSHDIS